MSATVSPDQETRSTAPNSRSAKPPKKTARPWLILLGLMIIAAAALMFGVPKSDPERLFLQAQELARSGQNDRAAQALEQLARLRAPDPTDRLLRAQVAAAQEQIDQAISELGSITDDHPLAPLARLSQGQFEARRGRLRFAESAFRATLKLLPECVQAHRELIYILSIQQRIDELDVHLAALSESGSLDLKHLIHWGMVRHTQWSAAADLDALRRYVAADPDDQHSRLALIDGLIRVGRLDEARPLLAASSPVTPDIRVLEVKLAVASDDLPLADTLLRAGPESHPVLARLRGQRALARRDSSEAVRQFRLACSLQPHDRTSLAGLAMALRMDGEIPEAEKAFAEVRKFDELGTLLARAEGAQGQVDTALARELGTACAAIGRLDEARAWLKHAITVDPLDTQSQQVLKRLGSKSK